MMAALNRKDLENAIPEKEEQAEQEEPWVTVSIMRVPVAAFRAMEPMEPQNMAPMVPLVALPF
jgi:hypothetical protein